MKELKTLIKVLAEVIAGLIAVVAGRIFIAWLQQILPFWVACVAIFGSLSVLIGWNLPQD